MRPAGWRYESARHARAAKGVPTGRRYNYVPTYVAGDLPLIAGDALGVAGAEAVSLLPAVVPVAMLYGGAKIIKKQIDKNKKKKVRKKRKYDAAKKANEVEEYVRNELHSNGKSDDFLKSVGEQIRHPLRDMDKDWQSMMKASGHRYRKENGVQLAEDRAAAVVGKVVTQANVEPLVDKNEVKAPARQQLLDVLFGRRAYSAYKPGTVTRKTVIKLRWASARKQGRELPKGEQEDIQPGNRVLLYAEGIGRKKTFPFPDKVWVRVTSRKRQRLVGEMEQTGNFIPFLPLKKVSFRTQHVMGVDKVGSSYGARNIPRSVLRRLV